MKGEAYRLQAGHAQLGGTAAGGMAQYAQDGGARSQSMPFGCKSKQSPSSGANTRVKRSLARSITYRRKEQEAHSLTAPSSDDATWLAQQPSHMQQFGISDNFAFNQQHQQAASTAGGSILNQNDNSLLGDFFSNPEIANQMAFNYGTAPEDRGGEDSKEIMHDGLFDLDDQSATVNDPGTALGNQHLDFSGGFHGQSRSGRDIQQHGMNSQMVESYDNQEQNGEATDEEETKAKVADSLMGMSTATNRQNSAQLMSGNNMNGLNAGASWGGFNPDFPNFHMRNTQSPHLGGRRPGGFGSQNMMGAPNALAPDGLFGYTFMGAQYPNPQGPPMGVHMQQQAYAAHGRGRPHSIPDIHTPGFTHLPPTEPRSAQLPNSGYPNFTNFDPNTRTRPNMLNYGTDNSFDREGYRPPSSAYDPTDEKAANLTQVPFVDEASANASHSRASPRMPPRAGMFQAGAQMQQSQGYNSSNSQPPTPTYYNHNQNLLAGLPTTPNGRANMGGPGTYRGGFGGQHFNGHAHPAAHYYNPMMHANRAALSHRQVHEVEDEENEDSSSSEREDSETDSPPPQSQPASKRRKSNYEHEAEDDYRPPTNSGKRRVNSTLDGSSDEDEYGPDFSTGKKRARTHTTHRNSIATSASGSSPAVRTPRPNSAASGSGKRSSRKRQSGSHIPRAPLTDEQRRMNHIKSEKNRRDLIKTNYTELNNIIPALKGGKSGLSKSEVLKEIVEFIEELEAGNEYMEGVLETFQGEYDHAISSSEYGDEGPGGAAGGLGGIGVY